MLLKRARFWLAVCAMLSIVSLFGACSGNKTEEANNAGGGNTADAGGKKYASKGDEGSVTGKVAFSGTAPEPKKVDTAADPYCASKDVTTEEWAVKDGKVANTFVYIKDGQTADGTKIGDYTFDVPSSAAVLDQNGCHYKPHVLGMMANQKLSVTNSDQTTHNVHPQPSKNTEWNQSQSAGAPPIEKTFSRPETLVPVKCNQHPWMKSYIGVLKHPFFAVSKEDGSYEIKGVPAGTYTVAAWHEGPGQGSEKTMSVTVPAKGAATADFTLSAGGAAATQSNGLQMMSAIEFPMLGKH